LTFLTAPKKYDYAVEIRNPNYLKKEFFEFLKERDICPVLVEGYYMPHIGILADKFDLSSGRMLVMRLMGPDRKEIEKLTGEQWDKVAAPKDKELDSITGIVKDQIEQGREVVVNVNNHYEGCAVMTIERLMERLVG
jgi:uncharacterized protein YecE (DUF72 family)